MYQVSTGRYFPRACDCWSCETCRPLKVWSWAKRAAEAQPQRSLTLTNLPEWRQHLTESLSALWKSIRREFGPQSWEYWGIIERTPRRQLLHLHALQKGSYVPQSFLSRHAQLCGLGRVCDIRQVESQPAAARYAANHLAESSARADIPGRRIRYSRNYLVPQMLQSRRSTLEGNPDWLLLRMPADDAFAAVERARAHWFDLGFREPDSSALRSLIRQGAGPNLAHG